MLGKKKKLLDKSELLVSGLDKLKIQYTRKLIDKLLIYNDLLVKWNKVFNLTAIKEPQQVITHHFLDCMAVTPHIRSSRILDVGAGAGLPGIVLALMLPEAHITLVDKVGKKTAFIKQVIGELDIKNAEVVHNRVEKMSHKDHFDGIITRAFSEMDFFIKLTRPLIKKDGYWYAMKSKKVLDQEMNSIDFPSELKKITVPFMDAERYLVTVQNLNHKLG